MTAMSFTFRRPHRRHRSDGTEELTRARIQLERIEKIAAEQEQESAAVRARIETNHIAAALKQWIIEGRRAP